MLADPEKSSYFELGVNFCKLALQAIGGGAGKGVKAGKKALNASGEGLKKLLGITKKQKELAPKKPDALTSYLEKTRKDAIKAMDSRDPGFHREN